MWMEKSHWRGSAGEPAAWSSPRRRCTGGGAGGRRPRRGAVVGARAPGGSGILQRSPVIGLQTKTRLPASLSMKQTSPREEEASQLLSRCREGEAVPLPEGGVVGVAGGVVVGREHEVPRLLRRRPGGPEEAPRADDAVPPPAHGRRAQRARHGQEGEDAFRNVVGEDAVDRYRAAGIVGVDAGVGRGVGVPRRGAAANEGDGSVIHR
ncbi:F-box/kelch-repeat protein [Iris pallida]|uniref:F-box/kelch-repeat protein n=1 Tax=Iris pallida TaxID=29817 RepID=A0AAX6E0G2_IRIPA|nr:F-box/kelch-repeat protein [Iris pallida]